MSVILSSDETSGIQTSTNDVLGLPGLVLPTRFGTVLTTVTASAGHGPIELAESGANGVGSTSIATFGSNVTNVSLTDSTGALLNGLDSGLKALDGSAILLYSQSDDNVVFGRVGGSTGAVAFVLYLDTGVDTGTGDPGATSAKLWMAQYLPLQHIDEATGLPNDVEYLSGKLFVGADSAQSFSLEGAPSGQNLFLMFGDGTPSSGELAIVVTGKHPSTDGKVTDGDTVNTGKGGGATTIGSNNQMIDPGEGMYFTFVQSPDVNYTVPNLDQNEADVAANIQFASYHGSTTASFAVVQTQPTKGVTLKITAINNQDLEKGADFIAGLAPKAGETVNVLTVTIQRGGTAISFAPGDGAKSGITVDFSGDTAKVAGLVAGDTVLYTTEGLHNRVLIDNAGNGSAALNASFDIGHFSLGSTTHTSTALGDLAFYDDVPTIDGTLTGAPGLVVDESSLAVDASQSFAAQFTPHYGTDGAAASAPLSYALSTAGGASGVVDSATGTAVYLFAQGGQVVGRVGNDPAGAIVFVVSVDASGNVSLDQQRAVIHSPDTGPDQSLTLSGSNLVVLTATATDKDGDTANKPLDITAQITFKDDAPTIDGTLAGAPSLVVDESDLAANDSQSFAAQFTPHYGADGAAAADPVTYALSTAGGPAGVLDSATGSDVYLFAEGGQVVGRVGNDPAGAVVFVIGVDGSGTVSLDQQRAVIHSPDSGPDQSLTLSGSNLVVLTGTATDKDGDTASKPLDITAQISFKDDAPTIDGTLTGAPSLVVDESDLAANDTQSFAAQFTPHYGADGAAASDPVSYALSTAGGPSGVVDSATGSDVYLFAEGGEVVGRVGNNPAGDVVFVVSVDASGKVTLDQQRAVMHVPDSGPDQSMTLAGTDLVVLTARATDKDGDWADAPLDITAQISFKDDAPTIDGTLTEAPVLQVDEASLGTDDTHSFSAQFTPHYGADGPAPTDPVTYALSTAGGACGLLDSGTGDAVYLFLQDGKVVGRAGNDAAGPVVFWITVDPAGSVTLDQQRAVVHESGGATDNVATLSGSNLVVLTATATDKDGDTADYPLDLTLQVSFKDDLPVIEASLVDAPSLVVDDSSLGTDDSHSFSAQFTIDFGEDGPGTPQPVSYALDTAGGPAGLVDSATGDAVYLFAEGGHVVGRVGSDGTGAIVFVVSVDAGGNVTLDQQRAVMHTPDSGPDQMLTLSGTNLVVLVGTAYDGDEDDDSAPLDITSRISFKDDAPTIDGTLAGAPSLVVDESDLAADDSQSFAAQFTPHYGADGAAAADPVSYALSSAGGPSGVVDSATGTEVYLFEQGGQVVGRVGNDAAGAIVFVFSVDAGGNVTLDQQRAVMHSPDTGPDQTLTLSGSNLVVLSATATDEDGDTASKPLDLTALVSFKDDAPTIDGTLAGAPSLVVDESDLATDASQSFAAQFTPHYGADGAAASDPVTYALSTAGGPAGVVDSATGSGVYLFEEGGQVVGRVGNDPAGAIVFVVGVDGSGNVSLDQRRAVLHTPDTGPDQSLTLSGSNLVVLTATATDKDGDMASKPLDITAQITFKDDAPTMDGTLMGAPSLVVDESALAVDGSASFAAQFTPHYGADGAASTDALTYALSTAGGNSGLVDSATGTAVYLFLQGGQVVGRVGNDAAGAVVFVVGVDGSGNVSLDQQRAIMHTPDSGPDQLLTLSGSNLVVLTATATDKDGDSASKPLDITAQIGFKDDAPTLAFGNLLGTGTAVPQYGYWSALDGIGADGVSAPPGLDITQNSFHLVRPDGSVTTAASFTLTEGSPSPDGSGAYVFNGSVSADFDNNGVVDSTPLTFTLTAYADGRYAIDLTQGFGSTITTFKTSDGLAAGGPDPVRTLYIPNQTSPTETIVFFSAKPLATTAQIQQGIGIASPGQPDFDPTEAQLQTTPLPDYIDPRAMNVSTSGIGIANNILQGDSLAAIGAADESFVVNPKSLVTSAKVFIDNSVGGYNTSTEDLYYRTYYSDGTTSGLIRVAAGMLTAEAGGQVSFKVPTEAGKLIDGLQLIMARGEVKIPVIEFSRETASQASEVHLDFTATLTDKDGDSATSQFSVLLDSNQLTGTAQYELNGTTGVRDDFNVDLGSVHNTYLVTGFDTGAVGDKLVLLGAAGAATPVIDNSGPDSVVTITEAGGQVSTVTVVGVDLQPTDLLLVTA